MTSALCITVVAFLVVVTQARLVFPPGSDVGYIVSDDPETRFDDNNGIDELESDNHFAADRLVRRGEREAIDAIESALLRTIADSVQLSKRDDDANQPKKTTVQAQNRMADVPADLKDDKHGVAMGIPHVKCDNGKVNLSMDWDESPMNFTCFDPKNHRLPVREDLESVTQCVDIPRNYIPQHFCMNRHISYNSTLPLFGPHRPLWPTYGEYIFIPPQRWLHSIEHGGVVMLYHPCAEPIVVNRLKKVLVDCFRKHVITPYSHLTLERPLALVAWGCSLEMATVDEKEVKSFIKKRALHGPEGHMARDGSFKRYIITKAKYPPGANGSDKNICPMDNN